MTPESIKETLAKHPSGRMLVKYVRVGDVYRFGDLYGDHQRLVQPGEIVRSAGFIMLDCDDKLTLEVKDRRSDGLRMGPVPDDEANLKALFGVQSL